MKNLILLVLLFVTTVCNAQIKLEGNKEGVYRVKEDTLEWVSSSVTAEPKAIEYIDSFSMAIMNPGDSILVEKSEKTLKLKPLFKKLVEVEKGFIVYNNSTKNINYFEVKEPKEKSSYLALFSSFSIILMLVSNIIFRKGSNIKISTLTLAAGYAVAATLAASVTLAVVSVAVASTFSTVFGFAAFAVVGFAALVAALAASAVNNNNIEVYKVASIIFYILMAIHIVLLLV